MYRRVPHVSIRCSKRRHKFFPQAKTKGILFSEPESKRPQSFGANATKRRDGWWSDASRLLSGKEADSLLLLLSYTRDSYLLPAELSHETFATTTASFPAVPTSTTPSSRPNDAEPGESCPPSRHPFTHHLCSSCHHVILVVPDPDLVVSECHNRLTSMSVSLPDFKSRK